MPSLYIIAGPNGAGKTTISSANHRIAELTTLITQYRNPYTLNEVPNFYTERVDNQSHNFYDEASVGADVLALAQNKINVRNACLVTTCDYICLHEN